MEIRFKFKLKVNQEKKKAIEIIFMNGKVRLRKKEAAI